MTKEYGRMMDMIDKHNFYYSHTEKERAILVRYITSLKEYISTKTVEEN